MPAPDRPGTAALDKRGTALVTGATAGIGAAFAQALAGQGYDLVLVARDGDRLARQAADLGTRFGVAVAVLPADLATVAGCDTVAARLAEGVDLLVNNAGRSLNMGLLEASAADQDLLLDLNVRAVLRLTVAALPPMLAQRAGAIVNVSSVSAFAPVMPGSTYPASKAWVSHFTESVALAVRPGGVRVMALCPGYTRTEFHQRAGIDATKVPAWLWCSAADVVAEALRDLRRGRLVSVPGRRYRLLVFGMRHAPRSLLRWLARPRRVTQGLHGGRNFTEDRDNTKDRPS